MLRVFCEGWELHPLKQFRNYCGLAKVARCGFPGKKTTKRPVASRDFLRAALTRVMMCGFLHGKPHAVRWHHQTQQHIRVRSTPIAKLL